ncbi:MAG: undecaprenyl-diphosphate phosphatase [Clostridia bacterium]
MNIWESVFLGALQGLTEFLPISSSGHLILAGQLFNIPNDLFFNVFLHVGTLLSVVIILRKKIFLLFTKAYRKVFLMLVLATIPTVAIALLVKIFVPEEILDSLLPIGFALTIFVLLANHFFSKGDLPLESRFLPPIITGVVQGIAVLPGLSRSGSTIATLSLFGVNRVQAVDFSFLMSIPIICGSALVEGYEAIKTPVDVSWYCVVIGIVVAFLVGCLSIRVVSKLASTKKLVYFAIYLVLPLITSLILL